MSTKEPIDYQPVPLTARKGYRRLYVAATLGVLLAVLLRGPVIALFTKHDSVRQTPQIKLPAVPASVVDLRALARERLEPDLAWADRESQRVVGDHIGALDVFFTDAEKRTPAFAKDVLGWRSKWYLVLDKMPYTRTDRQAEFLKKAFNDDIFSPQQLTQVLNQLVKNYVDSITGIENQMLVKMRADIADLPPSALPSFETKEAGLRVAFDRALAQAQERAGADFKADIGREATSMLVGEVLTAVAVRMGVEGGILAVGAGTSWETLGIGLVVAVIVDQVVSWVWDWYRNPVGELTGKMNDKLDGLNRLIVDGDQTTLGLRARLNELSRNRPELRRAAIAQIVGLTEAQKP